MPRNLNHFIACSVPDCSGNMIARGWCRTHYCRWARHGSTALAHEFNSNHNAILNIVKRRTWKHI